MNQTKKTKNSVHKYLEPLLDAGADESMLHTARKQYVKEYKATWQREYRKANKQFTISFNKKELAIIDKAAIKHHRKSAKFIKDTVLAYCENKILIANPNAYNRIRELLIMNYSLLQELSEENNFKEHEKNKLISAMSQLEIKIYEALSNPTSITSK